MQVIQEIYFDNLQPNFTHIMFCMVAGSAAFIIIPIFLVSGATHFSLM